MPGVDGLTSIDAQFLAVEDDRTQGHICGLLVLARSSRADEQLTVEELRELASRWAEQTPALRKRVRDFPLGLVHPYWQEADRIEIARHVQEAHLAAPGTPVQLTEHVAAIHSRPLDRRHPLWEMHLLHGVDGAGQALLIKAHHAGMDGAMGLAILGGLLASTLSAEHGPPPPALAPPSALTLAAHAVTETARHPIRAARALPRILPHLDGMPMTRCIPGASLLASATRRGQSAIGTGSAPAGVTPTPRTVLNGRISSERSVAFRTLPLREIHAVRRRHRATVNDLVVWLVASALRAWLLHRRALPAQPLIAMVPVSLRGHEQHASQRNAVTSMLVSMPTDEADPALRLARTVTALRAAKDAHLRRPASLLEDANDLVPPAAFRQVTRGVARLATHERIMPPCNVVISNLPGPEVTFRCAGAPVEALYPVSAIVDGVGLNVTVVSYAERLHVGLVADRVQMPEPNELADALASALDELAALPPPDAPRRA